MLIYRLISESSEDNLHMQLLEVAGDAQCLLARPYQYKWTSAHLTCWQIRTPPEPALAPGRVCLLRQNVNDHFEGRRTW